MSDAERACHGRVRSSPAPAAIAAGGAAPRGRGRRRGDLRPTRARFEQLGTLDRARQDIAAFGGRVVAVPFDLESDDTRAALVDQVEEQLGPVDILVNNAAAGMFRTFLDWTDSSMAKTLEPGSRPRGS